MLVVIMFGNDNWTLFNVFVDDLDDDDDDNNDDDDDNEEFGEDG